MPIDERLFFYVATLPVEIQQQLINELLFAGFFPGTWEFEAAMDSRLIDLEDLIDVREILEATA